MVWMARLAKLRRTWAIVSTVFTVIVIPLTRWLWNRHKKSVAAKKGVIDITAREIKKDE